MNKLIVALACVALVGCVAVSCQDEFDVEQMSQSSLHPTDEEEVAALTGDKAVFGDFCVRKRDELTLFLKNGANDQAANIFESITKFFGEVTTKIGQESSSTAQEGTQMISKDSRFIVQVIKTLWQNTKKTATQEIKDKIEDIKDEMNFDNFVEKARLICESAAIKLRKDWSADLEAEKKIYEKMMDKATLKAIKLNTLGCVTTKRVSLVARGCDLFNPILTTFRGMFAS